MNKIDKLELAIKKGITYNPETGNIYGVYGKVLTRKNHDGYIYIQVHDDNKKQQNIFGHQLAWYYTYKEIVDELDHINQIRYDNRIENLRVLSHQHNMWNKKSKGCYWNKKLSKWQSCIGVNYKQIHLGYFEKEEDAKQAYLDAKKIYHKING